MNQTTIIFPEEQAEKSVSCCSCKKSHCLKLYCECFAAKVMCSGCSCVECRNNHAFEAEREQAIAAVEEKNAQAFFPKISRQSSPGKSNDFSGCLIHTRGCCCKKSHCKKRYCECFQSGIFCTEKCKCSDCHNRAQSITNFDDLAIPSSLPFD